jgi:hypothetical protein
MTYGALLVTVSEPSIVPTQASAATSAASSITTSPTCVVVPCVRRNTGLWAERQCVTAAPMLSPLDNPLWMHASPAVSLSKLR